VYEGRALVNPADEGTLGNLRFKMWMGKFVVGGKQELNSEGRDDEESWYSQCLFGGPVGGVKICTQATNKHTDALRKQAGVQRSMQLQMQKTTQYHHTTYVCMYVCMYVSTYIHKPRNPQFEPSLKKTCMPLL
jgi:hypothetical protein